MVNSKSRAQENGIADDRWTRAMRSAGVSEETITTVIEAIQPKVDDLVTLEEAQGQFPVSYGMLNSWVSRGHLTVRGRVRFPAPGGGKVLVDPNDVEYLIENPPKQGRPPRIKAVPAVGTTGVAVRRGVSRQVVKSADAMVNSNARNGGNGNADARWTRVMRSAGVSEETISDVVEATLPKDENLITLEEAAEQHGIPYGTLTRWIHVGHLNVVDRIKIPCARRW